jgi:hypothetical protein
MSSVQITAQRGEKIQVQQHACAGRVGTETGGARKTEEGGGNSVCTHSWGREAGRGAGGGGGAQRWQGGNQRSREGGGSMNGCVWRGTAACMWQGKGRRNVKVVEVGMDDMTRRSGTHIAAKRESRQAGRGGGKGW